MSLFGNATGDKKPTTSPFGGAPASSSTGGGLFGGSSQPAASSGGGLFGAKPADPKPAGGLFGGAKPAEQPKADAPSSSLFGGADAKKDEKQSAPIFGGGSSAPQTSTFGEAKKPNNPAPSTAAASPFGAKPKDEQKSVFGETKKPEENKAGGNLFGAPAKDQAQPKASFGEAKKPETSAFGGEKKEAGGLFGANNTQEKQGQEAPKPIGAQQNQPQVDQAEKQKAEDAERLQFESQTLDQVTKDWFKRVNQSEKVFRDQEKDLMSYELSIFKLLGNMEELQKQQVEQQSFYKHSLEDLSETIRIQSQLSQALTQSEAELDSYIKRFVPNDMQRIEQLVNSLDTDGEPDHYYGSERVEVYQRAKTLDSQIQELEANCKDIQLMLQEKQNGRQSQLNSDSSLVSRIQPTSQIPNSFSQKENLELTFSSFHQQLEGLKQVQADLEFQASEIERRLQK